ncbi:alpha/beta fold hydrolase [Sphingomonas glacialis]|uniref:Alpha/beta fold hydrolase n=1 Tax=Sphingomonas glacialis TaxID=658225 RepID=A0A502FJ83_9SPHN|nr:alpha/beta hydrolase [Sphingomonas glacialis]TPG49439.1 alpha/beta fold hydrolase [Sphingomonas glacialis]
MIVRGYTPGRYGQLHYRAAGAHGGRPTLVLLHQNPSSSLEYEALIEELTRDRRVIAFDTPGYGMSDAPPAPLDMAGYAACFAEALPAMGLADADACDVYGFHTGALLAIELAIAVPEAVRRVVVTGLPMRSPAECAERLANAQAAPVLDESGDVALTMARGLWDYVVAARTPGVELARAARVWVDKLTPLDRAQWAYHGVWSYDFAARLPLVGQSTLLLQPAEAIMAQSIAAATLFPNGQVVGLPEFDRDLFDLPEAIARMSAEMRRFLDQ